MSRFNFCVGNPPFQEENDQNNRKTPIYNAFMEAAYGVADVVELITPGRFLFDAGQTPKSWNEKMLADEHLKVLMYESDSVKVFPNVDIKGGVAVTIRDANRNYGAIGVFTDNMQLNVIKQKVAPLMVGSLMDCAYPKSNFGFSQQLYIEHPELKSRLTVGNEFIIDAKIFDKMPEIFCDEPFDGCVGVYGRYNNQRVCKYTKRSYMKNSHGIDGYKIFLPGANGTGQFGGALSTPFVGEPNTVGTQTFMSFGFFGSQEPAENLARYLRTKFARCMLSILKVTQNNPKGTWRYVPLQDFTQASDINWTLSISEIDQQLYKKYGLNQDEIDFIENNVKEMT